MSLIVKVPAVTLIATNSLSTLPSVSPGFVKVLPFKLSVVSLLIDKDASKVISAVSLISPAVSFSRAVTSSS